MIHLNQPFKIGDAISSSNKNFSGVVKYIGWYLTKIQTFECRSAFIPNSLITNAIIENLSYVEFRKIDTIIRISCQDFSQIDKITTAITQLLREQPDLSIKRPRDAYFTTFETSSLSIQIRGSSTLSSLDNFLEFQQTLLIKIGNLIATYGAEMK